MIMGNHEKRYQTNIEKLNAKDLQTFINPHILEMYTEGFTLYIDGKKKKYAPIEGLTYVPHWYVNIDNRIIVAHPTDFSKVPAKTATNLADFLLNQHEEFQVAVLAHTHKYSTTQLNSKQGVFVVENGCLCQSMDYASKSGKLGYNPQSYCYTIIRYNKNEDIDINNIKTYHLKEEEKKEETYSIEL